MNDYVKPKEVPQVENDPTPLMRQLSRMAGIPYGNIRKMVLVLDVEDVPRLYTEEFMGAPDPEEDEQEELIPTHLVVHNECNVVKTTAMFNEKYHTQVPRPKLRDEKEGSK